MPERFEALLESTQAGTVVEVPFDAERTFGDVRPPVRGTLNDAPFRSTLAKHDDRWLLVVNPELAEAVGASEGDWVAVEIDVDDEPRAIEIPQDLREALLAEPDLAGRFDGLSYSHQKEYVDWVNEAKREETRGRRIEKTLEMVRGGAPAD